MEELRIAFLLIGTVFILAVLVHGIWKIRKQNGVPEREQQNNAEPTVVEDGFDELGLGKVRVVSSTRSSESEEQPESEAVSAVDLSEIDEPHSFENLSSENLPSEKQTDVAMSQSDADGASVESSLSASEGQYDAMTSELSDKSSTVIDEATKPIEDEKPLYANVVSKPKPQYRESTQDSVGSASVDIPDPPSYLLNEAQTPSLSNYESEQKDNDSSVIDQKSEPDFGLSSVEQTVDSPIKTASTRKADSDGNVDSKGATTKKTPRKRSASRKRKEPTLREDQMRIDFDEPNANDIGSVNTKTQTEVNTEVLVINVKASEGNDLSGAALLPLLLTLGFKFGEHDIFHRHVNANGKGPVLFSLANMVKPGVFDIDNLETFRTLGISLFMVLPIEGDPHQVFNMMHNAARKIAEEFDAQLLDGRRSILTKQGIQRYVEKIREFERQRMIAQKS